MKKTSLTLVALLASATLLSGCAAGNTFNAGNNAESTGSNDFIDGSTREEREPIAEKSPAQAIATSDNGIFDCPAALQPVPDDNGVNGTASIEGDVIKLSLKNDVNITEGMGAEIVTLADPHTCAPVARGLMVSVDDSDSLVVKDADIQSVEKADVGDSNAYMIVNNQYLIRVNAE